MPDLHKMLGQVKEMQQQLQKKLETLIVEASAGGGMVTVKMNGQKQLLEVRIDPEILSDREMLQELVAAAVNEAARKVDSAMQAELGQLAGGLALGKLPGLF
jgi:hypothetical protein